MLFLQVFRCLSDLLPSPPSVDRCVTDFECAVWKAIRVVFPTITVLGCAFHWAQAIWRKVQDLGLASAYKDDPASSAIIRTVLALAYLPAEHIQATWEEVNSRVQGHEQFKALLAYVRTTWLESTVWDCNSWSLYRRAIRTNNDVEGWHNRVNTKAGQKPPFFQLLQILHREARLVPLQVRLLNEGRIVRQQRRVTQRHQGRLHRLWDSYDQGTLTTGQLLKALSNVCRPRI